MLIKAGATSRGVDLFFQDSTSTTGAGKTGLAYNTAGWKVYYRKGLTGTLTAVTLATQTVGGAYSSGGFVEIDSTNASGSYRFDMPNAAIDTAGFTTFYFSGPTGVVPLVLRVQCVAFDPEDIVRLGLTALPNVAAGASGGLPTGNSSGQVTVGGYASGQAPLQPTTAGRTLDVSATGEAGIDFANIGSPTTTVNLSGTTVGTVTAISSTERNAIADSFLDRVLSAGANAATDTARSVRNALRSLVNKVAISGSTMTVYQEDDTTTARTAAVTGTTGADPITTVDPT